MEVLNKVKHSLIFYLYIYVPMKLAEILFNLLIILNFKCNLLFLFIISSTIYFFIGLLLLRVLKFNITTQDTLVTLLIGLILYIIPYMLVGNNVYTEEYQYLFFIASLFQGNYILNAYISYLISSFTNIAAVTNISAYILSVFYNIILLKIGNTYFNK